MNIKNNLVISIRRLKKDFVNTVISVLGLVLGLGIVSVILVFVVNELSSDKSFANKDRIYRVLNYNKNDNNTWANTPFVLGEVLANNYDEVEEYAHQYNIREFEIKKDIEFIPETNMICTEGSFFDIFSIHLIKGSLNDFDYTKQKVFLSQNIAQKYFDSENPVGKKITLKYQGEEKVMEVSGIYKDLPNNSTIKPNVIASIDFGIDHLQKVIRTTGIKPDSKSFKEAWEGVFFTNYLLLKKETDISNFERKLGQIGKQYSNQNSELSLSLQPYSTIYFDSANIVDNNNGELGDKTMLYVLATIGLIILVVASINYLNLASAKAMEQNKTFAINKVCGAKSNSLLVQMITESLIISFLSLPLAILVAHVSLPYISEILGKEYMLELGSQFFITIGILILVTALTGMISGYIVTLRFSSLNTVEILQNRDFYTHTKFNWKNALVIFQITVFISLIATMILMQKQVHYGLNKDLGFKKEGLVRVSLGGRDLQLVKQELANSPNIVSTCGTLWMPPSNNTMYISIPRVDNRDEMAQLNGLFVDYHFAETMGIKVLLGSDFDEEKTNSGVLVNESAINALGLTNIIGEETPFGKVIGLISDFNMYTLHEPIKPMLIGLNPSMAYDVAIKVRTENLKQTIDEIQEIWDQTGTTAFNYEFVDDTLKTLYESDIRLSKTIGLLSVIAIAIASLGLFGLSLFMGRQRTKEIGVRKVNGAKIYEVTMALNMNFIKWVTIAFLIAIPISVYAMNFWLKNFAYKTEISWWIFALAGLTAMAIALLTVSFQTFKAASKNPIETLRYE